MSTRKQFLFFIIVLIGIFNFNIWLLSSVDIANAEDTNEFDNINNNFFQCGLDVTDPWDPSIPSKFFESDLKECVAEFRNLTFISDGFVHLNLKLAKNGTQCQWQCLVPGKGDKYLAGKWRSLSVKPKCDVLKVQCFADKKLKMKIYENLLIQIIPNNPPQNPAVNPAAFNIHIFVIDAVSRSQGLRFLPKTIEYLEQKMEAFHFPFYTKTAYNSWPNGNAFLVGKAPPRDDIPPMITKVLADNQTFEKHYIGNILQRSGYVTLFNEDVFSIFPDYEISSTHTLAPFSQEFVKENKTNMGVMLDDLCQTSMDYNTEMFSHFVEAYPEMPKFSMSWNTRASHDQLNHLHIVDEIMLKFLKNNQKEFDNSFFFFLGDHGPNFGDYRLNEVIALEEMNPMLYVSIPRHMRSNAKLLKTLRENTKKLVSHYDVYASMIDAAISAGADIPLDVTLHGTSLFKPIPEGRDCSSMGISPMYCNCRYKRIPISRHDPIRPKIIEGVFVKANQTIHSHGDICKIPIFDPNFEALIEQVFVPGTSQKLKVYRVVFETMPDHARWETYVYAKFGRHSIEVTNMVGLGNRNNPFGPRCFNEIMDYCFCKKL